MANSNFSSAIGKIYSVGAKGLLHNEPIPSTRRKYNAQVVRYAKKVLVADVSTVGLANRAIGAV